MPRYVDLGWLNVEACMPISRPNFADFSAMNGPQTEYTMPVCSLQRKGSRQLPWLNIANVSTQQNLCQLHV